MLKGDTSTTGEEVSDRNAFFNMFKHEMFEMSKNADEIGQEGYQTLRKLCGDFFPKMHDALQKLLLEKKGCVNNAGASGDQTPAIVSFHSIRKDNKRKSTNGCLK